MPLLLLPTTMDDIPALVQLYFEVFLETNPITKAIYPNGAQPTILDWWITTWKARFLEPRQRFMKVVDTDMPNSKGDCILTQAKTKQ